MELFSIGIIHSPFSIDNLPPDQGIETEEISEIEIYPKYRQGLEALQDCDKFLVLYWMEDGSKRDLLYNERKKRGCFATRSPNRPNPIAVSIVKVVNFNPEKILVKYLEAFDGSAVLDLKPYSRKLDGNYKKPAP